MSVVAYPVLAAVVLLLVMGVMLTRPIILKEEVSIGSTQAVLDRLDDLSRRMENIERRLGTSTPGQHTRPIGKQDVTLVAVAAPSKPGTRLTQVLIPKASTPEWEPSMAPDVTAGIASWLGVDARAPWTQATAAHEADTKRLMVMEFAACMPMECSFECSLISPPCPHGARTPVSSRAPRPRPHAPRKPRIRVPAPPRSVPRAGLLWYS